MVGTYAVVSIWVDSNEACNMPHFRHDGCVITFLSEVVIAIANQLWVLFGMILG